MSRHFSDSSQADGGARWDYGGLEVDTRAADNTDKHLDPHKIPKPKRRDEDNDVYLHEKEIHIEERERDQYSPSSVESPMDGGTMGGATYVPDTPYSVRKPALYDPDAKSKSMADVAPPLPPDPEPRKMCGLRRRTFWILFGVVLAVIVAAAIIGGVIAGTRKTASPASSATTAAAPAASASPSPSSAATTNTPLLSADVITGSPLNVISYTNPGAPTPQQKQTLRMYYQSVIGNIKETVSDAFGPWQSPWPLFTDAVNNTGLATITWNRLNDTAQTATIYYIDGGFKLQEKRKGAFNDSTLWEQASLGTDLQLTVRGNVTTPDNDDNDPVNNWDGYRLAAVYSRKFFGGPQSRLFFRSQENNGTSIIQELAWNQTDDTWSKRATFDDAWPNSHFAASIDESTNILRLFFSVGGKTLQEYWTDISTPDSTYRKGITLKNYLPHNNVDISVVSLNGTTYLYYYSPAAKAIKEMQITGTPGDINNQESFNSTGNIVVAPAATSNLGNAVYQPLTAAKTDVVGLNPSLFVFWADTMAGMDKKGGVEGGYHAINEIQKIRDDKEWPEDPSAIQVPLGNKNAQPWVPGS